MKGTGCRTLRAIAIVLAVTAGAALGQTVQVTTTTYSRNADGALTAVTTQVDNGPAATVYLTWDNFQPNTGDPTTGIVSAANGNLLGYGASPGGPYATQLQFDQRNRLASAAITDFTGVTYAYYAASRLAAATLASNDTLQFYYNTAQNQVATNLYQQSTGTWSSYLDQTTYLNDGTEQVRLQPRKDVAGQFDAAAQSLTTINYEPYGSAAPPAAPPTTTYDMTQNPFQYTGELRDPTWGGYYLRARWYLPALATFVSRDPFDAVQRYAYANANPVCNTDPSGFGVSMKESRHDTSLKSLRGDLRKILKPLDSGAPGLVLPLFFGAELTVMQIVAYPGRFWHSITHDRRGVDFFLAESVLAEAGGTVAEQVFDRALPFGVKAAGGAVIGAGQSFAAGYNGADRPFNWYSFGQSLEYAANAQAEVRSEDARLHFDKKLSSEAVNEIVMHQLENDEIQSVSFRAFPKRPSGPLEEWWQQVRGAPQETYEVWISRSFDQPDTVGISGKLNDFWGSSASIKSYDPSSSAAANISNLARENSIDFRNTVYDFTGATEAADVNEINLRENIRRVTGERPTVRPPVTTQIVAFASRVRRYLGLAHLH